MIPPDIRVPTIGSIKQKCPNCKSTRKPHNRHDTPLSVSRTSDGNIVWNCHNCNYSGSSFEKNYKPIPKQDYVKPKLTVQDDMSKVYKWFDKRGISQKTVDDFDIKYVTKRFEKEETCIVFPYKVDGEIWNHKYRTSDKKFKQDANARKSLFNIDNVKKHWESSDVKEIVFVEGEMDVMSFYEIGIPFAVSLSDGAPNNIKKDESDKRFVALSEHECLEKAERVYIATDNDEAGRNLSEELIHRFGKDICWVVNWGEYKDANENLVKDRGSIEEKLKSAVPFPIEGLYTANKYRSQLIHFYNNGQEETHSVGFPSLDGIYRLMLGTFHLITGVPNHGKSNFLDQILINMTKNKGWNFAVFSPEHSTPMHLRRLTEKFLERPFEKDAIEEYEINVALNFIDKHFVFIESEKDIPTIDWILEKAKQAKIRYGIKGIIIDPYNEIDAKRAETKREDEHIRDVISACKQFARRHEVVVFMVAHPNKLTRQADGSLPPPSLYDVSGSAHWNNMCDVGVVIYRDFETNKTRFIVRKVREAGLYGAVGETTFEFDLNRRVYVEDSVLEVRQGVTNNPQHWSESYD